MTITVLAVPRFLSLAIIAGLILAAAQSAASATTQAKFDRWLNSTLWSHAKAAGVSEPPGSLTRSLAKQTASPIRPPSSWAASTLAPPPPARVTVAILLGLGSDFRAS